MTNDKSNFFLNQPEPNKSCLLALREIILQYSSEITETIKYGMPCFCYAKKPAWYLWTDKKTQEPYILFVNGNEIEHPMLEQGTRSKMKILRVKPNEDIPRDLILSVIAASIQLRVK